MIRLVTGEEMRRLDQRAISECKIPVAVLMDHAGRFVAEAALAHRPTRVTVVCGKGNNGGDGWIAARWLKHWGVPTVQVVTSMPVDALQGDCHAAAETAIASGVPWTAFEPGQALPEADVYIDALLGTGVTRPVTGRLRELVEALAGKFVISVDVPSGIDADTGTVQGVAVQAMETIALACEKLGTAVTPGAIQAGVVRVVDIGIGIETGMGAKNGGTTIEGAAPSESPSAWAAAYLTAADVASWLPKRTSLAHKGTYGKVAIGAGDMRGAARLAALGALRVGVGLVRLGVDDVTGWSVGVPPEVVLRNRVAADWRDGCDAIVIGPGLGSEGAKRDWWSDIEEHPGLGVLDADALTRLLNDSARVLPPNRYVLTPHPKECGLLIGWTTADVQANRVAAAREAARRYQAVVVLKGYRSVIATPSGNIRVNSTGNAALATAGTGDILAGMIGGLLAQGLGLLEAACAGAFLHGRAGEIAGERMGLTSTIASDVVDGISRAIIDISTFSQG